MSPTRILDWKSHWTCWWSFKLLQEATSEILKKSETACLLAYVCHKLCETSHRCLSKTSALLLGKFLEMSKL